MQFILGYVVGFCSCMLAMLLGSALALRKEQIETWKEQRKRFTSQMERE